MMTTPCCQDRYSYTDSPTSTTEIECNNCGRVYPGTIAFAEAHWTSDSAITEPPSESALEGKEMVFAGDWSFEVPQQALDRINRQPAPRQREWGDTLMSTLFIAVTLIGLAMVSIAIIGALRSMPTP